MKIRPAANRIRAELRKLSTTYDTATGKRHRFEPPGQLRMRIDLERLITDTLSHEPEEVCGEKRWTCFMHSPDTHPSLWCRNDHRSGKPTWGCNSCNSVTTGDVYDFLARHPDKLYTQKDTSDWIKSIGWRLYPLYPLHSRRIRVRLRRE